MPSEAVVESPNTEEELMKRVEMADDTSDSSTTTLNSASKLSSENEQDHSPSSETVQIYEELSKSEILQENKDQTLMSENIECEADKLEKLFKSEIVQDHKDQTLKSENIECEADKLEKLFKSEIVQDHKDQTLKSENIESEADKLEKLFKSEIVQDHKDQTLKSENIESEADQLEKLFKSEIVQDHKDQTLKSENIESEADELQNSETDGQGVILKTESTNSHNEQLSKKEISTNAQELANPTKSPAQFFVPMEGVRDDVIFNVPTRHVFKVIFAGEPNVGKSSIIQRFVTGRLMKFEPTIGVDFSIKVVRLDEKTAVRMHIFDLAGSDRVSIVSRAYFRRSDGAMFVYDESHLSSLDNIKVWKAEMDKFVYLSSGESIPSILLGNKCDKESEEHVKRREQIREFAKENGILLVMDTSAKENTGIQEAFKALIEMMIKISRGKRSDELEDSFKLEGRILAKDNKRKCVC